MAGVGTSQGMDDGALIGYKARESGYSSDAVFLLFRLHLLKASSMLDEGMSNQCGDCNDWSSHAEANLKSQARGQHARHQPGFEKSNIATHSAYSM